MANEVVQLEEYILYKNKYPFPPITSEEFVEELLEMEVRDDDIFIVTYQKSGTHWMQEVVNLILVKGEVEKLTSKDRKIVIELADVNSVELVASKGPVLREVKDSPSPRVLTTHVIHKLLPRQIQEKRCKVIYVYRNGKDVFASKYNFYRKFYELLHGLPVQHSTEQFSNLFDAMISGKCAYGRWFEHVLEYYEHRDDENFCAVSFEEMKKDLRKVVVKLASFLGQPLDEDGVNRVIHNSSLEVMKKSYDEEQSKNEQKGDEAFDASTFVVKGTTNQWKEYFNANQIDRFDKLFGELMGNCDWTKTYAPDVSRHGHDEV